MHKTFETVWEHKDQNYQVRLYEDMRNGSGQAQDPLLIVERGDGQLMNSDEARGLYEDICARANPPLDTSQTRLWEQSPNGKIMEYSFDNPQDYDANPLQNDMKPDDYQRDVAAGEIQPQMATRYDTTKTEVSAQQATVETGHRIQSYEQQMETDWQQLSGPQR